MKVIDVSAFHEGIDRNRSMLQRLEGEIRQIAVSIEGLVSMQESLKGEGGAAIRSFYEECHLPLLTFFQAVKGKYDQLLQQIDHTLIGLEPVKSGYIHQGYLEGEIESGLSTISQLTADVTEETNHLIRQVSDIVALPTLQDQDVQKGVQEARQKRNQTMEAVHDFDATQTAALQVIDAAFVHLERWLADLEVIMQEGLSDVYFPSSEWKRIQQNQPISELYRRQQAQFLSENPRVQANDVKVFAPGAADTNFWEDITSTVGLNPEEWKTMTINAATNLGVAGYSSHQALKDLVLARKGFGIQRTIRITAQGKERVVLNVSKPELMGIRKKTYSHTNATNYTKIFKYVDPKTNVKEAFKLGANRIGYVGIVATVTGDIVHGVQNNQSKSEMIGNVTGDVAVAGASIAASAYAGAKIGAMAGALGGPVGFAVGATAGLVAGVAASYVLGKFKVMDVDGDGKSDSIGDAIKKGTTGMMKKISSWF